MAIQIRRGNKANFDEAKLLSGELALCEDTAEVYVGVPGTPVNYGEKLNKGITETTVTLSNISINSSGWASISVTKPTGFFMAAVKTWTGGSGAISVTSDASYVLSTPSTTITSLTLSLYSFA